MPEPITAIIGTTIITAAVIESVKRIVRDAYDGIKGAASRRYGRFTDDRLSKVVSHLASVRLVKTIWQVDKEVDLHDFYHPTKVNIGNERKQIASLDGISKSDCIVFEGIVGQGKSIFLRHLACQELIQGKRIPLFLELRRIPAPTDNSGPDSRPLLTALLLKMEDLGLDGDEQLFITLAQRGRVVLMLDAFDELAEDCVKNVLNELESLHQRYPSLQIVITSRPDSPACRCPMFRVLRLCYVAYSDVPALIACLVPDPDFLANIVAALERSTEIHDVLKTPLMVTLLVLTFKAHGALPESLSGFYEELVPVLLSRHDHTKPGFVRPRKCGLSDHRIRRVFEAFCFIAKTRIGNKPALSEREIHKSAARAIKTRSMDCDETAFIKDIVNVTCLLLEEAGSYYFLHKSVQEFGAAAFVKDLTNDNATAFYEQILGGKWFSWQVELGFLSDIDKFRYMRHFYIQDLDKAISRIFQQPSDAIRTVSGKALLRFINDFSVIATVDNTRQANMVGYQIPHDGRLEFCIHKRLQRLDSGFHALFNIPRESLTSYIQKGGPMTAVNADRKWYTMALVDLLKYDCLPEQCKVAGEQFLLSLLTERRTSFELLAERERQEREAISL